MAPLEFLTTPRYLFEAPPPPLRLYQFLSLYHSGDLQKISNTKMCNIISMWDFQRWATPNDAQHTWRWIWLHLWIFWRHNDNFLRLLRSSVRRICCCRFAQFIFKKYQTQTCVICSMWDFHQCATLNDARHTYRRIWLWRWIISHFQQILQLCKTLFFTLK